MMTMIIRSVIQYLLSRLLAVPIVIQVIDTLGLEIDAVAVTEAISVFIFGISVAVLGWAAKRWPIVNNIMSLGRSRYSPDYSNPYDPGNDH